VLTPLRTCALLRQRHPDTTDTTDSAKNFRQKAAKIFPKFSQKKAAPDPAPDRGDLRPFFAKKRREETWGADRHFRELIFQLFSETNPAKNEQKFCRKSMLEKTTGSPQNFGRKLAPNSPKKLLPNPAS